MVGSLVVCIGVDLVNWFTSAEDCLCLRKAIATALCAVWPNEREQMLAAIRQQGAIDLHTNFTRPIGAQHASFSAQTLNDYLG